MTSGASRPLDFPYGGRTLSVLEGGYNIVRHAGAAVALLDLYGETHAPRYLNAAGRAIRFLKTRFRPAAEPDAVYV